MNRTLKIYGILFLIVVVLLVILELNKKEVLDWRKNFDPRKKTPFGLFVFDQEASALFKQRLKKTTLSPFDFYRKNPEKQSHNILIVNQEIDQESWKKILNQVEKGSNALIFAHYLGYEIMDTLNIDAENAFYQEKITLHFTDKKLKKDCIILDKYPNSIYFNELPKNAEILGYATEGQKKLGANFVKVPFGKGYFYLHKEPLVLTNYYLLNSKNTAYIQNIFSYLPDKESIWFLPEYQQEPLLDSPMRFILGNAGLRYAWWLLLGGLVLFILFNSKRKQRIIPIIEPPKNKSVEFVKSIGNLYLQEGSPKDMALKKIQYFLHKVRTELMIDTQHLDETFIKKLHAKTGKSLEKITEAVALIKQVEKLQSIKQIDLIKINHILDEILK